MRMQVVRAAPGGDIGPHSHDPVKTLGLGFLKHRQPLADLDGGIRELAGSGPAPLQHMGVGMPGADIRAVQARLLRLVAANCLSQVLKQAVAILQPAHHHRRLEKPHVLGFELEIVARSGIHRVGTPRRRRQ